MCPFPSGREHLHGLVILSCLPGPCPYFEYYIPSSPSVEQKFNSQNSVFQVEGFSGLGAPSLGRRSVISAGGTVGGRPGQLRSSQCASLGALLLSSWQPSGVLGSPRAKEPKVPIMSEVHYFLYFIFMQFPAWQLSLGLVYSLYCVTTS